MGKWWYAEIAFVIIVVGGFIATNRSPGGKARLDAIKLKLPVIGDLTETAIIERTCRILASMLRAGWICPAQWPLPLNRRIMRSIALHWKDPRGDDAGPRDSPSQSPKVGYFRRPPTNVSCG